MTTHRDSQIDANAPVPAAVPAQTRLPWTAPRLERLQGGDARQIRKTPSQAEFVTNSVSFGPS